MELCSQCFSVIEQDTKDSNKATCECMKLQIKKQSIVRRLSKTMKKTINNNNNNNTSDKNTKFDLDEAAKTVKDIKRHIGALISKESTKLTIKFENGIYKENEKIVDTNFDTNYDINHDYLEFVELGNRSKNTKYQRL